MQRIRGKRQKRAHNDNADSPRQTTGRPMKQLSELQPTRSEVNKHMRLIHAAAQSKKVEGRTLSPFESLPTELIQNIFFLSLEVNLLRTSRTFRQVLNTDTTYNILILFAYFEDDGENPVETKHFLPAEYWPMTVADRTRLQMAIWDFEWCKLERLATCLPILWRLNMFQAWHNEFELEQTWIERLHMSKESIKTNYARWAKEGKLLPDLNDEKQLEAHFLCRTQWSAQVGQTSVSMKLIKSWNVVYWRPEDSLHSPDAPMDKLHESLRVPLGVHYIPDRLLDGRPWTEERLVCLQLLRQSFGFLEYDLMLKISANATFEGMIRAIEEGNHKALLTLLEIHAVLFRKDLHSRSIQDREGWVTADAKSYHPIPPRVFHAATKQGTHSSKLLELLLRGGWESLPQNDDLLTSWAIHATQRKDDFPARVLKIMENGQLDLAELSDMRVDLYQPGEDIIPTRFADLEYVRYFVNIPRDPDGGPCGF